jgi:L-lactate dehydrogenase (cytochrome)
MVRYFRRGRASSWSELLRSDPFSVEDVRRSARRRLPRPVFDFVEGGADDEVTLGANRAAFRQLALRPRRLAGIAHPDLSTTVLGMPVRTPVLLSPIGLARLMSRDGELAVARAATHHGTIYAVPTMSTVRMETVRAGCSGPLWFQLTPWRDNELIARLVRRAATAGYTALVVTVDVPVVGKRERDLRHGFRVPPRPSLRTAHHFALRPAWSRRSRTEPPLAYENLADGPPLLADHARYINDRLANPGASWEDLKRIRTMWDGPIVLKGVMTAEDAERALECGMQGILVSNHGGRQLDTELATLDALPAVLEAVRNRAEVYLDGGVRRGSDVVKALALGARACFVGRPYMYGLAHNGQDGVSLVLDLLRAEIETTMTLAGRAGVADLDASLLTAAAVAIGDRP